MAGISALQAQNAAIQADKAADVQNERFRVNQEQQIASYNNDMAAYWDEETALRLQNLENAEETVAAGLALKIEAQEKRAELVARNLESVGGGQSPDRQLGLIRRQLSDRAHQLEEGYEKAHANISREARALQLQKVSRLQQAKAAINGVGRARYATKGERLTAMTAATASGAMQGYSWGSNIKGPKSFKKTTIKNVPKPTRLGGPSSGP